MRKKPIILVAAMSRNRVIGYQNRLPWHMPADLHYFKEMTLGKTVIMGRKTFESIGKRPLPNRRNIIISRTLPPEQTTRYEIVNSLQQALLKAQDDNKDIMIIGGQAIYEQALPLATDLYITMIDTETKGDTFFPEWNAEEWEEVSNIKHSADKENPYDFRFIKLRRRAA